MFRAAVCDDMPDIRQQLIQYFDRFCSGKLTAISVDEYESGAQLLSADFGAYDLLILDVQMGEPNGIETARRIRSAGGDMTIVFFTNYVEYALEGYEVQAFRFLLKPLSYEQFSDVVGKILLQHLADEQECIQVHQKDAVVRVPAASIAYVETERGHVLFHTRSGECISSGMTMKEAEDALASYPFFRCHTSYLVNIGEIRKLTQADVILKDETVIPLSKHRKKQMKEVLAQFWGDQFL